MLKLNNFLHKVINQTWGKIIHKKNNKNIQFELKRFLKSNSKFDINSPLVLIWELGGFPGILKKDAIISIALNSRGFRTHFIICDGLPEACIQRGLEFGDKVDDWHLQCYKCISDMVQVAKNYNIEFSFLSNYIDKRQREIFKTTVQDINILDIIKYKYLDVSVGEIAWSSLNRYLKGLVVDIHELNNEHESVFKKYLYAALINTYVANKTINLIKPISVFTSHGVYVDYAPPIFLAYKKRVKSLYWLSGYANFLHYYFTPKDFNKLKLRSINDQGWNKRKSTPLTFEENKLLDNYIYNRYFHNNARDVKIISKSENNNDLKMKLQIFNENPTVCLFTHVSWDATFFSFNTMIFDNANSWVIESINTMMTIKNVNWIIRIHPGELTGCSTKTTDDIIKEKFKKLPSHIKILWSNSHINAFDLFKLINSGITIYGTIGVELPLFGKPVIVAGDAPFSNKGFTIDAKTKDEYFDMLKKAAMIKPLDDNQINYARLYAYSYFIQKQVPLNVINKSQGHWGDIDLRQLNKLLPGKDYAMDKICDGIINGKDVVLE